MRSETTRISLSRPRSHREIKEAIKSLKKMKTTVEEWIGFIGKTSKALALANVQRARDGQTIESQDLLIRQLSTRSTRKKVPVDPNTRFASIAQIKQAETEQRARDGLITSREQEIEAKKAAEAMMNVSLESCQFEWQL